ncbi:TGF beta receptor associated related, putative [Babesia ovata]|uniref:TGF beta receptor associated related, putative n=1 Tax=Babesia ovata TaxID=189622 RepID=A0A2H6K9N9_9APIC|nr:TGF beta receptor associated related, putative [Babesia ovata]GBE59698.1 TGF beta receptor associated related, putative [Babesia ovata]
MSFGYSDEFVNVSRGDLPYSNMLRQVHTGDPMESPRRINPYADRLSGFASLKTKTFDNNFKDIEGLKRKSELMHLSEKSLYSKLFTPKLEALQRLVEPGRFTSKEGQKPPESDLGETLTQKRSRETPRESEGHSSSSSAQQAFPAEPVSLHKTEVPPVKPRAPLTGLRIKHGGEDYEPDEETEEKPPQAEGGKQPERVVTLVSNDEVVNGIKKKRITVPKAAYKPLDVDDKSSNKVLLRVVGDANTETDNQRGDNFAEHWLYTIENFIENLTDRVELCGNTLVNTGSVISQLEAMRPLWMPPEIFYLFCIKPVGMDPQEFLELIETHNIEECTERIHKFSVVNTNAMGYVIDAENETFKELTKLNKVHKRLLNEEDIYSKILAKMTDNFNNQVEDLLQTTRQDLRLAAGDTYLQYGSIKNMTTWKTGDPIIREKGFSHDRASKDKMKTLQQMQEVFGEYSNVSSESSVDEAKYIYYMKLLQDMEDCERDELREQLARDRTQALAEYSMYNTVKCAPVVYKQRLTSGLDANTVATLQTGFEQAFEDLQECQKKFANNKQIIFATGFEVRAECIVERMEFIRDVPVSDLFEKTTQMTPTERFAHAQVIVREITKLVRQLQGIDFVLPLKSSRLYLSPAGAKISVGIPLAFLSADTRALLKKHEKHTIATLLWGKHIDWYLPPEAKNDPGFTRDPSAITKAHIWMIGKILYEVTCDTTISRSALDYSKIELCEDADARDFLKLCLNENILKRPSVEDLLKHPFMKRSKLNYGSLGPVDVGKVQCAVEILGDIETIVLNKINRTEKGVADYEQNENWEAVLGESSGNDAGELYAFQAAAVESPVESHIYKFSKVSSRSIARICPLEPKEWILVLNADGDLYLLDAFFKGNPSMLLKRVTAVGRRLAEPAYDQDATSGPLNALVNLNQFCVGTDNKLYLYSAEGQIEQQRAITVDGIVHSVSWFKNVIVIGTREAYYLLDAEGTVCHELCSNLQVDEKDVGAPALTTACVDGDVMVVCQNIGIFYSTETMNLSKKNTIQWRNRLEALGCAPPYVIGVTVDRLVEVYGVRDQLLYQTIDQTNANFVHYMPDRSCVLTATPNVVTVMKPKSYHQCLADCIERKDIKQALHLADVYFAPDDPMRAVETKVAHTVAGWVRFSDVNFPLAFQHFTLGDVDIVHLISFWNHYAELEVPELYVRNQQVPAILRKFIPNATGIDQFVVKRFGELKDVLPENTTVTKLLEMANVSFAAFLLKHFNPKTFLSRNGEALDEFNQALVGTVEKTNLLLLAECDDPKCSIIINRPREETFLDPDACGKHLVKMNKSEVFAKLLIKQERYREAMDIMAKYIRDEVGEVATEDVTMDIKSVCSELASCLNMLIENSHNEYTDNKTDVKPEEEIRDILNTYLPVLLSSYPNAVILHGKNKNAKDSITAIKKTLLELLESNNNFDMVELEPLLAKLNLVETKVLVHSMFNRHEDALRTLFEWDQSEERTKRCEAYCMCFGDVATVYSAVEKEVPFKRYFSNIDYWMRRASEWPLAGHHIYNINMSDTSIDRLLLLLLKIIVEHSHRDEGCIVLVRDLLAKYIPLCTHNSVLNASSIVELIPDSWNFAVFADVFTQLQLKALHEQRTMAMKRGLTRSLHSQTAKNLYKLTCVPPITIDATSTCTICQEPIKLGMSIAIPPPNQNDATQQQASKQQMLMHEQCAKNVHDK